MTSLFKKIKQSSDAHTIVATFVALIPGFVFPFLLTLRSSPQESDSLLLAMSIMTTLSSVMGSAIELNTVSEFGRLLTSDSQPGPPAMRRYAVRIQRFGFGAVVVVGTLLTGVYSFSVSEWTVGFVVLCATMLIAPIASIYSSLNAGMLVGAGRAVAPIASQAFRPAIPIILLVAVPSASLLVFALGFGFGEIARWVVLSHLRRKTLATREADDSAQLETRGMLWQAMSSSVGQGGPSIERVLLASAPSGSVSAYELANKMLFAVVQFLNYGFLLRRVGRWSRIPGVTRSESRRILRRDLIVLVGVATMFALLGILALFLLSLLPLPEIWLRSSYWAMLLLLTAPLSMWISASSRLMIIARKQHYLLWFSLLTVASTLVFGILLFNVLGAFGVVVGTVCARLLSAVGYAVALRYVVPHLHIGTPPV